MRTGGPGRRVRVPSLRVAVALLAIGGLSVTPATGRGQAVIEEYAPAEGTLRIGPEPERVVPRTRTGHTLLLPAGKPSGTVVFFDARPHDGWADPAPGGFDHAALAAGLAVLHLTTGDPLAFFFTAASLETVAQRVGEIRERHGLAEMPVGFAGQSLGGTRALRMALFLRSRSDPPDAAPSAVAIVDAPLDFLRVWESTSRTLARDAHPAAVDEAKWVRYLLERNLGGPPDVARDAYEAYSPYFAAAAHGGNAARLRGLPIRAYHEPDVDWWIENRAKSYPDMNSMDLAGLVNELRLLGSQSAELVTTHRARRGFEDGASPHTWSIVDDRELAAWFVDRFAEERAR